MAKTDSAFFTRLSHTSAILAAGGVYRESDVFTGPDGTLFANFGQGYLRLYINGSTSKPSVRIHQVYTMRVLYKTEFGHLTPNSDKATLATPDFVVQLKAVTGPK